MAAQLHDPWISGSRAAADAIGRAIVRGERASGSRLPLEAELAAGLCVSRNTLREAMRLLAAKALVHIAPRRGTTVADRLEWNVLDADVLDWMVEASGVDDPSLMSEILEMRRMVEPFAAANAARRGDGRAIAAAVDRMEAETASGSTEAAVEADLAFHIALADASDNRFVARIGRSFAHCLKMNFTTLIAVPGNFERNVANHRAVADAIIAHDPETARTAMERLIDRAEADTHNLLGSRKK